VREINKLRKLLKQNGIDYDEHEIENMDYSIKDTGKMLVLNNFNQNRKGYDNKSN
jgi:arsenate reductase-like glutaredoxin family protein